MKIRTDELTGAALNWAVAVAEGYQPVYTAGGPLPMFRKGEDVLHTIPPYSTDWAYGGPIIERDEIRVLPPVVRRIGAEQLAFPVPYWRARMGEDDADVILCHRGPTPLIAAMRCRVARSLGDEVDVPDSLVEAP